MSHQSVLTVLRQMEMGLGISRKEKKNILANIHGEGIEEEEDKKIEIRHGEEISIDLEEDMMLVQVDIFDHL